MPACAADSSSSSDDNERSKKPSPQAYGKLKANGCVNGDDEADENHPLTGGHADAAAGRCAFPAHGYGFLAVVGLLAVAIHIGSWDGLRGFAARPARAAARARPAARAAARVQRHEVPTRNLDFLSPDCGARNCTRRGHRTTGHRLSV